MNDVASYLEKLDKPAYVKSDQIADELGRSPKSVGHDLSKLSKDSNELDFDVSKWGSSARGLTWKIDSPD